MMRVNTDSTMDRSPMNMPVGATRPLVLFVDDEENILHGIKRMMRTKRDAWSMEFVTSGAMALDLLDKRRADVVVSDMRMPHMDGATFLAKVRERFPRTVRIVLSGYAEREAILKTIGPSHRYLAKPCTEEALVGAIESSLRLRAMLASGRIQKRVTSLTHLPTAPKIFGQIMGELGSELASADTLADKVEQDIAISAQILKITNSAYFGIRTKVVTIKQAIKFLGFDNVRAVALTAGVFEQFNGIGSEMALVAEALSRHSLSIAILSQTIARAEQLSANEVGDAFCAGLLTHVGTLLLISNFPDRFKLTMADLEKGDRSVEDTERDAFGASHAELGAYLLNLWGFNDRIVEAVAYHHTPGACGSPRNEVLAMVHVAQYLLRSVQNKRSDALIRREPLDTGYLERVGVSERLPAWHEMCLSMMQEWSDD